VITGTASTSSHTCISLRLKDLLGPETRVKKKKKKKQHTCICSKNLQTLIQGDLQTLIQGELRGALQPVITGTASTSSNTCTCPRNLQTLIQGGLGGIFVLAVARSCTP